MPGFAAPVGAMKESGHPTVTLVDANVAWQSIPYMYIEFMPCKPRCFHAAILPTHFYRGERIPIVDCDLRLGGTGNNTQDSHSSSLSMFDKFTNLPRYIRSFLWSPNPT